MCHWDVGIPILPLFKNTSFMLLYSAREWDFFRKDYILKAFWTRTSISLLLITAIMAWEYVLLFCSLLNLNMSYILELSTLHGFLKYIYIYIYLTLRYIALSPNCLSLFVIKCTFTSATVQWMNSEWINCEIKVIFLYIKSIRIPKYHCSVTVGMILIHAKRTNI